MEQRDTLLKMLVRSGMELSSIANELNSNTKKLANAEYKINLVKAQLVSQGDIVGLPNQVMRDAKIEELLQCDPKYSKEYRDYLVVKTESKVIYTKWILQQELNKNIRVCLLAGKEE